MPENNNIDLKEYTDGKDIDTFIKGKSSEEDKKPSVKDDDKESKPTPADDSKPETGDTKDDTPKPVTEEITSPTPTSILEEDAHVNGISSAYGISLKDYKERRKESSGSSFWDGLEAPKREKDKYFDNDKGDDVMEIFWNLYITGFYEFALGKSVDFVLDVTDWVFFKRPKKKKKKENDNKINMYKMAEENYRDKCAYIEMRKELALRMHEELVNNLKLVEEGKEPVWFFAKKDPELKMAKEKLEMLKLLKERVNKLPKGYLESMAKLEQGVSNKNIDEVKEELNNLLSIFNKDDEKAKKIRGKLGEIKTYIDNYEKEKTELGKQDTASRLLIINNPDSSVSILKDIDVKQSKLLNELFNNIGTVIPEVKVEVSKSAVILERFNAFPKVVEEGAKKAKMLAMLGFRLVAEDMTINDKASMLPKEAIKKLDELQKALKDKNKTIAATKVDELLPFVDNEHHIAKEIKKRLQNIKQKVEEKDCDFEKLDKEFAPMKEEIISPKSYDSLEFTMINKEEAIERQISENIDKIYEKCESKEEISDTIRDYFVHVTNATKAADIYTRNIAEGGTRSKFKSWHKKAAEKTEQALESISNFMLKGKEISEINKSSKESVDLFNRKNKNYDFVVRYNTERRA